MWFPTDSSSYISLFLKGKYTTIFFFFPQVLKHTSFEKMKERNNVFKASDEEEIYTHPSVEEELGGFFRKGNLTDTLNHRVTLLFQFCWHSFSVLPPHLGDLLHCLYFVTNCRLPRGCCWQFSYKDLYLNGRFPLYYCHGLTSPWQWREIIDPFRPLSPTELILLEGKIGLFFRSCVLWMWIQGERGGGYGKEGERWSDTDSGVLSGR